MGEVLRERANQSVEQWRNSESGVSFFSEWRRDSARRLSLRSTGLSIRRGLSPRSVAEADSRQWRGPVGGHEEHNMMTMMMWVMTVGVLTCLGQGAQRRPLVMVRRQAGTRRPCGY